MSPTKIAFDPMVIPDSQPMARELNEIRRSMTVTLTANLRIADLVRSFQLCGKKDLAIQAARGNEIAAKHYVQMIDRFEALIMQGFGFSAALHQMLAEDWLIKLSNFETLE
jgi:hypothetical protein